MSDTPTVVIVDDHRIFRSGVRAELGEAVEVVGEAESVEDAVRAITGFEPDVVLLDVHMPGGGGVQVIEQVSKVRPQQRFLALSVSDDPQDVIAIVRAGARGYLYKEIAQRLSISTKTVEAHVSAVLRKLQLSNRHELSRWAVERRLVD